ncbi:hypothetical protein KFE25_014221 [Diacronema lutheri]|uniref:EF-hand domain-containing protein n=1 Tax=Diacronema lutheri TaxID=2081491 RepID=A0A8J5X3L0_DIALT|nr:hypothetical protein KFE25_014221 [Diacronema lutheri]
MSVGWSTGSTPVPSALYAREQIPIPPYTLGLLKEYQKATLRHFRGRKAVDARALLEFSHGYFARKDASAKARLAREEEYRAEWSGKKGEVRELFQQFDANGDGTIDMAEVSAALSEVSSFFGYTMEAAGQPDWMPQDEASAKALFEQLDGDADGRISWDEFWDVVSTWMEDNFDRIEQLRAREEAATLARERAAEEEGERLKALREAAAAAEQERLALAAKQKADADERARAEKAAAERAAAIRRAEAEAAAQSAAALQLRRQESNARAATRRISEHAAELGAMAAEAEAARQRAAEEAASATRAGSGGASRAAAPADGADVDARRAPAVADDMPSNAAPGESARAAARRAALDAVRTAAGTASTIDDLLPAFVAALGEAGARGAASGASGCVALRRVAARAEEAPIFVALTPASAHRRPWELAEGSNGDDAAGSPRSTPLMTVVWATSGHPHVQRGAALQRITERPVEVAAFAALDAALPASGTARAIDLTALDEREQRFVAAPLRRAPAVGARARALGVVGSGALADGRRGHDAATCTLVALRHVMPDGAVCADVSMASAQHPIRAAREGEQWQLAHSTGLAAFCLRLLADPPAELLRAAAHGDSSVFASYTPSADELGADARAGGFIAASADVRVRIVLDPARAAAASAEDGADGAAPLDGSAVLGIIAVGPVAATFETGDAPTASARDEAESSAADRASALPEPDVVLQVVAAPTAPLGSAGARAAVGTSLRSPFAAAEAAAAGGSGLASLEHVAHASYGRAQIVLDAEASLVALPIVDGRGGRLGVLVANAPVGASGSGDAAAEAGAVAEADEAMAYLRELVDAATLAVDAIAARADERAAPGGVHADSLLSIGEAVGGGLRVSAERAAEAAASLLRHAASIAAANAPPAGADRPAGIGDGGVASLAWAVLDRVSVLGADSHPVPAFVALREEGNGAAPTLRALAATPLHPLGVRAGQQLSPADGGARGALADAAARLLDEADAHLLADAGPGGRDKPQPGSVLRALRDARAARASDDAARAGASASLADAAAALADSRAVASIVIQLPTSAAHEGGAPPRAQLSALVDAHGRAFGVLVTGAPGVAVDAYQAQLSAHAGIALSHALRARKLAQVLATGEQMIELALGGKDVSVYEADEGAAPAVGEYVLVLRREDGSVMRTLLVKREGGGDFSDFDAHMLRQLGGVMADVFKEVDDEATAAADGDGRAGEGGDGALASTAQRLPQLLMQRAAGKLVELTSTAISELKSYNKPPAAVAEVMRSAFALLGHEPPELQTWHQLRVLTGRVELQAELRAVDPAALENIPRWARARRCSRGLDSDLAWKRGSKASALIFEWLQNAFVAHDLFRTLRKEALRAGNASAEMAAELAQIMDDEAHEAQADAAILMQRHARGRIARKSSAAALAAARA